MQKRPSVANRRKVILLHDNARPHVIIIVKQTLMDLEWEVFPHPAYSPDLAPSDYHLFRSMQHALEDTHFHNYSEVKIGLLNGLIQKTDHSFVVEFNFCLKSGKKS
ncbi:Mariner Mos1 transposase [Acromyrmex echinatior]|uniref:Mariner Mos1 transposase n=1 Tax=Acromyrmex echinatior TaxID=103372 RepID=F4WNT8_ACREC|nr:Mariner Mos1 transposase [Acromyrmex echinatior]